MRGRYFSKITVSGFGLVGVGFMLLAWHYLSSRFSGLVIASPGDTLAAMAKLLADQDFLSRHFVVSLKRIAWGIFAGTGAGVVLGIAAGLFRPVRQLLEPFRWMLTSIPGVVIVVVFMLWFGMGSLMVISITACLVTPIIFVNVSDAMAAVDQDLLAMAHVYRFTFCMKLRRVYAMTVAGPFFSGVLIATGNGIRIVTLAEVLGANEGIGYCLAIARTSLDTPELYALALISMSIVGTIEFFVLRPFKKSLLWNRV